VTPRFRLSFDLQVPRLVIVMAIVGIVATAGALMELGWRAAAAYGPWRRRHRQTTALGDLHTDGRGHEPTDPVELRHP
jgi:hypothetical protein